ncbi:MAG: MBL fold metallo-hydrolase [Bradyrhizobium sp.]|nr:MAG: MBL fold metallo-hydrolase [Bradyrhizobium sp.]
MSEPNSPAAAGAVEAPERGPTRLSGLVRRLIAPNPSPFTFTGTCSYILGEGEVTILDPGPADPAHIEALLAATHGERVTQIVITHSHRDHADGAAPLKALTGAPVIGARAYMAKPGAAPRADAAHALDYRPDEALDDGQRVAGRGFTLETVATPGHAANHLCFALIEENTLFSGDHVMAWSTTVVAPPDGAMGAYMNSLEKLRGRSETIYWPGHGGPVRDPQRYVRGLISHRRQREAAILARLDTGEANAMEIAQRVYVGLAPALIGAASLSTLAHLEDLAQRGLVIGDGSLALETRFRRA